MWYYQVSDRNEQTDLSMYSCGTRKCEPNHCWGPGIRDVYIIHYIEKGKGTFQLNNKSYQLSEGQGFIITPHTITCYKADKDDPWHYYWVGFEGLKAESLLMHANLGVDRPVFTYRDDSFVTDCISKMLSTGDSSKSKRVYLTSMLYLLLSKLIDIAEKKLPDTNENSGEIYLKKAVEYIEIKYSHRVTIDEISSYIGISRNHLYTLFKHHLNMSPQQFLIHYRINKACDFMINNTLSIGDVARSVGYDDPLFFSKIFKKEKGVCPKEYRTSLYIKNLQNGG